MAGVDVSTLAHAQALRAHVLNVVIWVTKPLIAQKSHGIVEVTLRDPERELSQWHNEIAQPWALPQGRVKEPRSHKLAIG